MPRKKQGLRSYHHKTRNGCMQCKRRRVKCNMQAPACGNCVRRNEICEYPTFSESNSPPELQGPQPPWANEPSQSSDSEPQWANELPSSSMALVQSFGNLDPSASTEPSTLGVWTLPPAAAPNSGTIETNISLNHSRELISCLFSHSWFSQQEAALWVPALARLANRFPYLQHGALAIVHLRQHAQQFRENCLTGDPVPAYQHQVMASTLFRQAPPTVNEENWMAVLTFGTFMLIFQFYTQFACDEEHFDLIETLRVIRSTTAIEHAASPYFRGSPFWALILARTTIHNPAPDVRLRNALQLLAGVISTSINDSSNDDDEEEIAEINRQAFWELREWSLHCDNQPRRWDHYCRWPSRVMPEYLDLLADGDDIALLILIHWAAIMFRSQKPFVKAWSKRTAFYAINRLDGEWGELLAWPLEELSPQLPQEADYRVSMQFQLPSFTEGMELDLVPVPTGGVEGEHIPGSSGSGGGLGPNINTTSA